MKSTHGGVLILVNITYVTYVTKKIVETITISVEQYSGIKLQLNLLEAEAATRGVLWKRCRPATLLKKRLWQRCFPVNFVKFLRTPFFIEHLWWLLLLKVNFLFKKFNKLGDPSKKGGLTKISKINKHGDAYLGLNSSFKKEFFQHLHIAFVIMDITRYKIFSDYVKTSVMQRFLQVTS